MTSKCHIGSNLLPGCVCDPRRVGCEWAGASLFWAFLPGKEKGPHRWESGEYWGVEEFRGGLRREKAVAKQQETRLYYSGTEHPIICGHGPVQPYM